MQLASLGGVLLAVMGMVLGSAYLLNQPDYTLLYTDLDATSATSVVERLKAADVPYELIDGGRSIRVASDRADEMRLTLASEGVPESGRIGFEVFDRTQFGTTEFLEQVNFRRALEGELARTISTISDVASARVHIALAKKSIFAGQTEEAKASVVLKLKSGRALSEATVRGIAGLIAGSVESLRPEQVTIVDTAGRPLLRTSDGAAATAMAAAERESQVAREMEAQLVGLLETIVGPGRARVSVAAQVSTASQEETQESFDPETVVRSRQMSSEPVGGAKNTGGVAGTRANLPEAGTAPANATDGTATASANPNARVQETTNYEVGKRVVRRIEPSGQVSRLSVAVLVDNIPSTETDANGATTTSSKPRDAAELERINRLVAAAIGLDTERGDRLTVENIAFDVPQETPVEAPDMMTRVGDMAGRYWRPVVMPLLLVAVVALAFTMVLRPMVRGLLARAAEPSALPVTLGPGMATAGAGPGAATGAASAAPPMSVVGVQMPDGVPSIADLQSQFEAQLDRDLVAQGMTPERRIPILTKKIARRADADPAQIATAMRGWLAGK
jgi:flagellar M-ring protein FliF